ncbi:MAG: D-alanyl-D-alanine carboxypeptidase family protein [Eubacteriales bacterium]
MKRRRFTAFITALCMLFTLSCACVSAQAQGEASADVDTAPQNETSMKFDCKSAILMEASTGKVLFEQNPDEALPPASVTKIMTLLLVMESVDSGKISLGDMVTASAHACSMGGSQIYLKEGEQMSVEDMIKSVVISSANDAAVALAEHIAGTEESFVEMMNKRASELGMSATNFENTNGLDDTAQNHVTSARDIALMSAELLKHRKITEYSSIWMDTVRNGEFGLTNTNRLVRFYKGANGLKTGSTSKAKFCISATAERDGMTLICVIMAAPTRDIRNAAATSLLDWGFANYALYRSPVSELSPIKVLGGVSSQCKLRSNEFCTVVNKADLGAVKYEIQLPQETAAPVKEGEKLGSVVYTLGDREIGRTDITAAQEIDKINYWGLWLRIFAKMSVA